MTDSNTSSRNSIFVILKEDTYETQFGDGYYGYPVKLCRHMENAEEFVTAQSNKDVRYHAKRIDLIVEGDRIRIEGFLDPHDQVTPANVVSLLVGEHSDVPSFAPSL